MADDQDDGHPRGLLLVPEAPVSSPPRKLPKGDPEVAETRPKVAETRPEFAETRDPKPKGRKTIDET